VKGLGNISSFERDGQKTRRRKETLTNKTEEVEEMN